MLNKISSSLRQGLFFGLNSGIITTTGLLAGISQTTSNPIVIIVSVVSLAISDSISEAHGLYISKKAEKPADISSGPLKSFLGLLVMKMVIVLSFLLPFIFSKNLRYFKNLVWPLAWAFILLIVLDSILSKLRNEKIEDYLIPHSILVIVVVLATKFFGRLLARV